MDRTLRRALLALLLLAVLCGPARPAAAHGLLGHVHVTGWAIENLPPGELRAIFEDADVFQAALSGAMFPDTGYALDNPGARDYGEYAHWEPFIESFIQHIRNTYGPTYETKEEKLLIAFLLGCASHGLQDELFDSTFLHEIEQRDGGGQDVSDPGTDGFLVLDDHFRLLPGDYFPIDEMLPLFDVLQRPVIDHDLIEEQIRIVRSVYVNDTVGLSVAANYGRRARTLIPWAAENYLDPSVAGSLRAEIEPTARHMEALWERLHGRFDEANLIVHAWPEAPRRLREANHQSVASWVTLVFGKGVEEHSATASLIDVDGMPHPFNLRYTRWGGTSRLVRFQATADYAPGASYTAILQPGARLVDGSLTIHSHQHHFQVECSEANDPECPPVVVDDDPRTDLGPPRNTATPTSTRTPRPATATPTAPPATATPTSEPVCDGDCNGDDDVTVEELLTCLNITLGNLALTSCRFCDSNDDGVVTVDEILTQINRILTGCL
ncbi:MAG TPA: zinc dependent phospholipase C family protein [Terriglobales bacterium]|nr:zinc dependent phospholipase C family protein [Terriglobales bacterium]